MKKSKNYSLNLPEPDDYVIIGDLNSNTVELDKLIKLINDDLAVLSTDGVSLKEILAKKADLGDTGKIPEKQLPDLDAYKDVLMYEAKGNFPAKGNDRKLYVDKATGRIYRWTGSEYTEVSNALDLGETSDTAYRGDRGKIAYDHSQSDHAPADALSREESYSRAEVDGKITRSSNEIKEEIKKNDEVKTYSQVYPKEFAPEGKINAFKRNGVVTVCVGGSLSSFYLPVGFRPAESVGLCIGVGNKYYPSSGSSASSPVMLTISKDGAGRISGADIAPTVNCTFVTKE